MSSQVTVDQAHFLTGLLSHQTEVLVMQPRSNVSLEDLQVVPELHEVLVSRDWRGDMWDPTGGDRRGGDMELYSENTRSAQREQHESSDDLSVYLPDSVTPPSADQLYSTFTFEDEVFGHGDSSLQTSCYQHTAGFRVQIREDKEAAEKQDQYIQNNRKQYSTRADPSKDPLRSQFTTQADTPSEVSSEMQCQETRESRKILQMKLRPRLQKRRTTTKQKHRYRETTLSDNEEEFSTQEISTDSNETETIRKFHNDIERERRNFMKKRFDNLREVIR